MTEEKQDKPKEEEETKEVQPEKADSDSMSERIKQKKAENDLYEEQLLREQELRAKGQLAGKSTLAPVEPQQKETAQEYAKRMFGGG